MSGTELCGAVGFSKGAVCRLPKGHSSYHTGPSVTWPQFRAEPGEPRPFHNAWLLRAVLQQTLRDLDAGTNPPNILVLALIRTLENFRHGMVDSD